MPDATWQAKMSTMCTARQPRKPAPDKGFRGTAPSVFGCCRCAPGALSGPSRAQFRAQFRCHASPARSLLATIEISQPLSESRDSLTLQPTAPAYEQNAGDHEGGGHYAEQSGAPRTPREIAGRPPLLPLIRTTR